MRPTAATISTSEVAERLDIPTRTAQHRVQAWARARQRGDTTVPSVSLVSGEYRIDAGELDAWRAGVLGRQVEVVRLRVVVPGSIQADQLGCPCVAGEQAGRRMYVIDAACPVHGQYFDASPSLDAA